MEKIRYKINGKVTQKEIQKFLNSIKNKKERKELYFSMRTPDKEIRAIKNSDIITARTKQNELVGIMRVVSDSVYYFHITDVMVIPSYRRRGIATKMMKEAIKYCKKEGYVNIFLVPVKGLEKFYSKFGFEISKYPQMIIYR